MHSWPVIYTSAYYWALVTGEADKAWISERCKLWVAHYGTISPIMPIGWTDYVLHQYSADGNGLGPTYGGHSTSMDLNYTRLSWLAQYEPAHDSWSWDVTLGLRALGQTVRDPE